MKRHQVDVAVAPNGTGIVRIDGSDISNSCMGVRTEIKAGQLPLVTVVLAGLSGSRVELEKAAVALPERSHATLVQLGWSPPRDEQAQSTLQRLVRDALLLGGDDAEEVVVALTAAGWLGDKPVDINTAAVRYRISSVVNGLLADQVPDILAAQVIGAVFVAMNEASAGRIPDIDQQDAIAAGESR